MFAAILLAQVWPQPLPPPGPLPPGPLPPGPLPQQNQPQNQPQSSDSDRGLEFVWARAEVGVSYMNLSLDSKALGVPNPSSGGLLLGGAAGARFLFFTVGARFRLHQTVDYNLWQLGGMLGVHIPSGNWDYGGDLYLGYASVGSFHGGWPVSPNGFHVGVEGGIDYYFVKWFSLGATIGFETLILGGGGKSAAGLSFNLAPHAALHF